MPRGPGYTPEEDAIIRKHFPDKGSHYCASLMPRRTFRSVEQRATYIGISLSKEGRSAILVAVQAAIPVDVRKMRAYKGMVTKGLVQPASARKRATIPVPEWFAPTKK